VDVEHLDNDITPEGFKIERLMSHTVEPASLTPEVIERSGRPPRARLRRNPGLRATVERAGYRGAERVRQERRQTRLHRLQPDAHERIRGKYEDAHTGIEIIGLRSRWGDCRRCAGGTDFLRIALLLWRRRLYWYCRSIRFTVLRSCAPDVAGVAVRQIASAGIRAGSAGDSGAFLVFSIGVSHGVQQINYIVRENRPRQEHVRRARASFFGVAGPGTLALV